MSASTLTFTAKDRGGAEWECDGYTKEEVSKFLRDLNKSMRELDKDHVPIKARQLVLIGVSGPTADADKLFEEKDFRTKRSGEPGTPKFALNLDSVREVLEFLDETSEDEPEAKLYCLLSEVNYTDLSAAISKVDEVQLTTAPSAKRAEETYTEMHGPLPSMLVGNVDWEGVAKDLSAGDFGHEFTFNGTDYTCTNMEDL